MAPKRPETKSASSASKPPHRKLPHLPDTQKISKRPLLHPPVAGPRTGSTTEKIIYVSASSPFISTIKRVRAYLSHIESRAAGRITLANGTSKRMSQKVIKSSIEDGIEKARGGGEGRGKGEEVMLKATGKAIERLLGVALFFQGEEGVKVEVRTGSVGAVDDVVEKKSGAETGESQVRRTSCLEVAVRLA